MHQIENEIVPLLRKYKYIDENADNNKINAVINNFANNGYLDNTGKRIPDDLTVKIVNAVAQNYVQKAFDTFTLIRSGADEVKIVRKVDHYDENNEVYSNFKEEQLKLFSKDGKDPKDRNPLQESKDFLVNIEDTLINSFCRFAHENKKYYEKTTDHKIISNKLNKIKELVSRKGTSINEEELINHINSLANDFPCEMFGTFEQRRGIAAKIVTEHIVNEIITNLDQLNYDVKKPNKFLFGVEAGYKYTNKEQGATFGVSGNWNLKNNWGLSAGLDSAYLREKTTEGNVDTLQLAANAGVSKTFNDRHTIVVNASFGKEVNKFEFNTLTGANLAYVYKINDMVFVGGEFDWLTDFKSHDINAGFILNFRIGDMVITSSIKGGKNLLLNKNIKNPEKEPEKDPEDERTEPTDPTKEGDSQDITRIPETPRYIQGR